MINTYDNAIKKTKKQENKKEFENHEGRAAQYF